jgi:hypothetical protein
VNFVSRDLLEARDLDDAMHRVCSPAVSVGHCYNLMDVRARRIVTVETASRNRFAVHEAGPAPSFHANMYLHLQVEQVLTTRNQHFPFGCQFSCEARSSLQVNKLSEI